MKQEKTVLLFSGGEYSTTRPPEDAQGFLSWFADKVAQAPTEFRDSVKIGLLVGECYGAPALEINIYYVRPETDEEENHREFVEAQKAAQRKELDLQMLADLQAKYGSGEAT